MRNKSTILALAAVGMMLALPLAVAWDAPNGEDPAAAPILEPTAGAILNKGQIISLLTLGFLGGYIKGINDAAGNIGDVSDYYKEMHAREVYNHVEYAMNPTVQGLEIDQNTILLTENFYSRVMEAEVSRVWQEGKEYDPSIIENTTVLEDMAMVLNTWANVIDDTWDTDKDARSKWKTSDYDDLRVYFSIGDTDLGVNLDGQQYLKAMPYARVGSEGITAYFEGKTDLVVIGNGITIIDADGAPLNLSVGEHADVALEKGVYRISGNGATVAGAMVPIDANDTGGACFIVSGDERLLAIPENGEVKAHKINGGYLVGKLEFTVLYPDKNGIIQKLRVQGNQVNEMAIVYDKLCKNSKKVLDNAISAARNCWRVFDAFGQSSVFLSPSSMVPMLSNVELDDEQRYVISLLGAYQLRDWYGSPDFSDPTLDDVHITGESLDMYVKGSIMDEKGNVLAANVVYSPYGYSRDAPITVGKPNLWAQSGVALVWANADDWRGVVVPSQMRIVPLMGNYILEAEEIIYKGKSVPSMTMTVQSLRDIENKVKPHQPQPITPLPNLKSLAPFVAVICALLGGMLAYFGFRLRSPVLMAVGLLLIVVGYFGRGVIANYLTRLY